MSADMTPAERWVALEHKRQKREAEAMTDEQLAVALLTKLGYSPIAHEAAIRIGGFAR